MRHPAERSQAGCTGGKQGKADHPPEKNRQRRLGPRAVNRIAGEARQHEIVASGIKGQDSGEPPKGLAGRAGQRRLRRRTHFSAMAEPPEGTQYRRGQKRHAQ